MMMSQIQHQSERQRPKGPRVLFLPDPAGTRFAGVENDDLVMVTERRRAKEFKTSEEAYAFGRANRLERMRVGIR